MSKKLMLLAAGALSALAFAALPAVASAEEYEVHCPKTPCIGTIAGTAIEHTIRLENDANERIEATSLTGTTSIEASTTTTGKTELFFKGVKEKITGFNFSCNSPGAAAGEIKTGVMSTHFINLGKSPETIPAVLLTLPAAGITFTCAGFSQKTVTGNIIGTITNVAEVCNKAAAKTVVKFNIKPPNPFGTQEHETWTGKSYDLTSGTHASDGTTSAQTGTGNITWEVGNEPTLTC
ncbi:MAG TPA: hypothetical protein VF125_00055 [Solirubrobacterales bacterium]